MINRNHLGAQNHTVCHGLVPIRIAYHVIIMPATEHHVTRPTVVVPLIDVLRHHLRLPESAEGMRVKRADHVFIDMRTPASNLLGGSTSEATDQH
jgi:hypothetical protein